MAEDVYIGLGDETDPIDIAQEAFDYLSSAISGWEPAPGNLETIIIESQAQEQSIERALAAQTAVDIFLFFGSLVGITPLVATPATGTATFVMVDDAGYTIPAGTQVTVTGLDGEEVPFIVVEDVVVPALSTSTGVGEVLLEAVNEGEAGSGLTGTLTLVDSLAFVESATIEGITTGGTDGETTSEYLDRLSRLLRLQAPRPILPNDFAALAQEVPGVGRATALDGYDPDTDTYDNERMVTVGVVDDAGEALSTPIKNAVEEFLEALREVNFLVPVIDPVYTDIDVDVEAVALEGYDTADVQTRVEDALNEYLSPANWGFPTTENGVSWVNSTVVRYLEVAQVINNVEGVDYIVEGQLEIAEGGGSLSAFDVPIAGPIALPRPGTITVQMDAP